MTIDETELKQERFNIAAIFLLDEVNFCIYYAVHNLSYNDHF